MAEGCYSLKTDGNNFEPVVIDKDPNSEAVKIYSTVVEIKQEQPSLETVIELESKVVLERLNLAGQKIVVKDFITPVLSLILFFMVLL
jgi:hypothetical protein